MSTEINHSESIALTPKKRVLFIITQSEIGGAQKFLHTLISHLDKDKYEILVAAGPAESGARSKKLESINYELLDQLKQNGIKTVQLRHLQREIRPLSDLRALFEIKKTIKKFCPDTLFLLSSKAGFLGSLAVKFTNYHLPISNNLSFKHSANWKMENGKWKIRPKVVYRIGGWSFNDPGPKWKKWLWILLERLSARWKDIIIVNSKHDLDQSKILKIKPRGRVRLIYNGLDVYKIDFLNREEARLKLFEKAVKQSGRIFNAETVMGTIANFYPTKGLRYLIETAEYFKNNDDVVFVVVGDGIERSYLEKLIAEKNLEKKVLLLGQLPDAYRLLSAFDIFVLPSVKEGFPWVVIEAMAAKLPVIATKTGAVPEIIEDDKNGMLIEPAHPEQMTKKIQELVTNEYLRQELGIQAHQTVLFKFPLEKMVKETESVF